MMAAEFRAGLWTLAAFVIAFVAMLGLDWLLSPWDH